MRIRTRSGGHDFEGRSYVAEVPFVIIDLLKLSDVTVDVEQKTAWLGAGSTIGTLYYRIAEKSRTLAYPAGFSPIVGVGGHFSCGGYGILLRKYGLAADHVIDARIADVNGRILDRKSMGEDLFWAIRGAGGASFGVVLAWKVQLVDVPEIVTVFTINRTLEQNATQLIHRLADNVGYYKGKSDYVQKPIPIRGFEGIWRLFYEPEGAKAEILLTPYGGRMAEISSSAIPFPHRAGNLYKLHHMVYWNSEEAQNEDKYINWVRRLYSYVAPYVSKYPRGAFFCYRDLDIGVNNNEGEISIAQARVWGTKFFKNNFDRLVHVKTRVDPKNFFREEQSIPPRRRSIGNDKM
ncbi:Berberine bridge enzyme-like 27 [Sesamum alatum]|uniref:Berberine bridge enzyme-like 27 n=1 Tax=Sesamum alatum TaxID=300844 RepID=A0AAE1Z1J9_9LAMI|nr:Berberine bridge enzyme-like 27 [Sesamum alatum]